MKTTEDIIENHSESKDELFKLIKEYELTVNFLKERIKELNLYSKELYTVTVTRSILSGKLIPNWEEDLDKYLKNFKRKSVKK